MDSWILLALYLVWALGLWRGLASEVHTVDGRLKWYAVPRRGVRFSTTARAFLPCGIVCWLLPAPVPVVALAVLFVVGMLLGSYPLIQKLAGGPDPVAGVRRIWAELEWLSCLPAADPRANGSVPRTMARLLERLQEFRTPQTAAVVDGLTEQAPCWFENDWEWSIPPVVREMRLYKAACALWPNDPPGRPDSPLDRDFLWQLFRDYEIYVGLRRADYSPAEKEARLRQLATLMSYRRPETEGFLRPAQRLSRAALGEQDLSDAAVQALMEEGQAEMDKLFPSKWVFRGATPPEDD